MREIAENDGLARKTAREVMKTISKTLSLLYTQKIIKNLVILSIDIKRKMYYNDSVLKDKANGKQEKKIMKFTVYSFDFYGNEVTKTVEAKDAREAESKTECNSDFAGLEVFEIIAA